MWSYMNVSVSFSQNVPPDVSVCSFVLAHCLSVRALQEMLSQTEDLAAEVRLYCHTTENCTHFTLLSSFLFLYFTDREVF